MESNDVANHEGVYNFETNVPRNLHVTCEKKKGRGYANKTYKQRNV